MFGWIFLQIYKYTFCKDIRHCIGICGIEWSDEQKQKMIEEDYAKC